MKEISSLEELDACLEASEEKPVFILKHSTRCPVSARAHDIVDEFEKTAPQDYPPFHVVKVVEARDVSDAVAERLELRHESPQLILVVDGREKWSASHLAITAEQIQAAVQGL